MTPVESLPLTAMSLDLMNDTSLKKTIFTSLPFATRCIRDISIVGSVCAVAVIIYGLANNIFVLITMGVVFFATSLSSFYLIRQVANLKAIEEDTTELKALDASIQEKDRQIIQMTTQLQEINQKMTHQQNDFVLLMKKDNALEEKYNHVLQDSANRLSLAETDAKTALEKTSKELSNQITVLQQQSESDQKLITQLNTTVLMANDQIVKLKSSLTDLQQQLTDYKQQNSEFTRLNTQLTQQIKTLKETLRAPDIDVTAISAHADKLEKQIVLQTAQRAKTANTMKDISTMLDLINKKLPPKTSLSKGV